MVPVRSQFIFAIWIILIETGAATTTSTVKVAVGQMLPYWTREITPNTKRFNNVTLLANSIEKGPKIRSYGRNAPEDVYWSSHDDDAKQTIERRHVDLPKAHKKYRHYNISGKDLKGLKISFKKAPNLRNMRSNEGVRSTRIAPLHLAQHKKYEEKVDSIEPFDEKIKNTNEFATGVFPFVINPYSVEKQFSTLLSEFDDAEFTTEVLGRSASYIDIVLFKIQQRNKKYFRASETKYVETEAKEKKILFIVHGLSPMGLGHLFSLTVETYLRLLMSYYLAHLDKFDIYLIPLANPDGYLAAKEMDYWNKNNAPSAACPGVSVDRNFDVAWNDTKTQLSSCSQHYPGEAAFSEPESRAVRDIFHRMSHKIVAYFHVHGGCFTMNTFKGDAVLYPKGYSDQQSDDDNYIDLKAEIDEAIKNANFKVLSVSVDTLYNWYGKVSGTSVDYAASVYGIPYAMEFVMQVYIHAFQTVFDKLVFKRDKSAMDMAALTQIWKRIIDVIFTNIHKKLEAIETAKRR